MTATAFVGNGVTQAITVISGVGHEEVGSEALDKSISLRCIALVTRGQREADWAAEAAHGHVDLGAQAAARTAKGLPRI